MTPELEQALHALFQKHHEELLQRGRREAYGGEQGLTGGHVVFTALYEGYELFMSYTNEPDEDLALVGGRKL